MRERAIRTMRPALAALAIAAAGLPFAAAHSSPAPIQDQRKLAVHDAEERAIALTERRLCQQWKPITTRLGRGPVRAGGADYAAATDRLQPRWAELDAARHRALLDQWVAREAVISRTAAADLVSRHLGNRSVRVWQAKVRFPRFPASLTVTRFGIVAFSTAHPQRVPRDADFRANAYHYIVSLGEPAATDINASIDAISGYLFLENGFGYFAYPTYSKILSLYPKDIRIEPRLNVPGSLQPICDR